MGENRNTQTGSWVRSVNQVMFCIWIFTLAACATSTQVLTGPPRSPLLPAEVRVYTQAPQSFEEIALLGATRKSVSTAGAERAIARMIEAMRQQAAELGANGLLLEDIADSEPVSVGSGVGSQTYTHNASVNLGIGGSLGVTKKMVKARAIFVPPPRAGT
jgi:hypothetical protein